MAAKKQSVEATEKPPEESSSAIPSMGGILLAMFQSWLENNADGAVDYGGSAAVVGAKKLGWSFEDFTEHMRRFWESDEARKF